MRAALSQRGIGAVFQSLSHCQTNAGNASGGARVKFPWPSFNSTATCLCSQTLLTSTSKALSPFTSRATICSPPIGAVTPNTCTAPAVIFKRIEYCVVLEDLFSWSSTVARSGFRSPSKSAMAKVELNPGEESGDCRAGGLLATAQQAPPRTKQKAARALTGAPDKPRLLSLRESMNFSKKRNLLTLAARYCPVRIPFPAQNQFVIALKFS